MSVKEEKFYRANSKKELKEFLIKKLNIHESMDFGDAIKGTYSFFSESNPIDAQLNRMKVGKLSLIYYAGTVKKQNGGEIHLHSKWVLLDNFEKRKGSNASARAKMKEFDK